MHPFKTVAYHRNDPERKVVFTFYDHKVTPIENKETVTNMF